MSRFPTERATQQCLGCDRWFTPSGLTSHLLQTTKPACVQRRSEQLEQLDSSFSDPGSPPPSKSATPSGVPSSPPPSYADHPTPPPGADDSSPLPFPSSSPQPFEGDYFGDYQEEDWEDFDEYVGPGDEKEEEEGEQPDDQSGGAGTEEADQDAEDYENERGWEPPPPPAGSNLSGEDDSDLSGESASAAPADAVRRGDGDAERTQRRRTQDQLRTKTFVVPFPGVHAGKPVREDRDSLVYEQYAGTVDAEGSNPYAPFRSAVDWKLAKWAKMRGPGSTAVTELLAIDELVSLLGLSFKNSRELNKIIDEKLDSGRPRFIRREIVVAGEAFEVFYRDVIACIRALYGDPEFSAVLVFTPERHYSDPDHTVRVYFDMHTGNWWWDTQKAIEKRKPGATIIPVIISSDKTQLTVFGSKTAYPVYLTIGNLPKDIRRKPSRRGQILLAYLPSTRLEHITSTAARRRVHANLYHKCMSLILKPLVNAGIHGIQLTSGDGVIRRGHPLFAMYIGDYPEQLLVTCCKNGTCPKCRIDRNDMGSDTDPDRELRNVVDVLDALDQASVSNIAFSRACRDVGIKPVRQPFWCHLPYVNIFQSITPDILHQLYQGVIKHVLSWLRDAYGADEIDARCRRLPPNHQIRLFMKGVTTLQRVTGKEHEAICRFMIALVVGLPLSDGLSPVRLVRSVRAILDFLYLARYPAHTSETLVLLRSALERFHANKDIFIDLAIRNHFRFPKLHSLDHYLLSIKAFGTTDNYDTQYTERLHIDFAKEAYRATNHRDEFPQMTLWLERREKVLRHDAFIQWRLDRLAAPNRTSHQSVSSIPQLPPEPQMARRVPSAPTLTRIKMTKWPTVKALKFIDAVNLYGATYIRDALARFLVSYRVPSLLTSAEVEEASLSIRYRFAALPVYHKIKFALEDAQQLGVMESTRDAVHARPARRDQQGRPVPARFDTVLVNEGHGGPSGVEGYRVGRVRLIFTLPKKAYEDHLPGVMAPGHLAYVEWFTAFTQPDPVHGMYKVTRCRGPRPERALLASVIEVRKIRRSCHLFPVAPRGGLFPRDWTSSTVLDECETFFVSPFSDLHMYMTLF